MNPQQSIPTTQSSIRTHVDLDRKDSIQDKGFEMTRFLTPHKPKETLKFLVVRKLFPRVRLRANMNSNF